MCELRVFLLLDWFLYQSERAQFSLLFIHRWREISLIHTFLIVISAMGNANNFVQDLNSGRCAHFLQG